MNEKASEFMFCGLFTFFLSRKRFKNLEKFYLTCSNAELEKINTQNKEKS